MNKYAVIDSQSNTVTNIIVADIGFIQEIQKNSQDIIKLASFTREENKRNAVMGDIYLPDLDIFLPPKPFNSWIVSEDKQSWVSPVPFPEETGQYSWNESTLSWDKDETV